MKNMNKKVGLALALALSTGAIVQPKAFAYGEEIEPFDEIEAIGELEKLDFNDFAGNAELLGFTEENMQPFVTAEEKDNSANADIDAIEDDTVDSVPSENDNANDSGAGTVADTDVENPENNSTTNSDVDNKETDDAANTDETSGEENGSDLPPALGEVDSNETPEKPDGDGLTDPTNEEPINEEDPKSDDEKSTGDENIVSSIETKALEDNITSLEEKLANGNFTEDSVANANVALGVAKALLENEEIDETELARAIAEVQLAEEGLVVNNNVDSNDNSDDSDLRDIKPEDLDGKEPGDHEELIDDDQGLNNDDSEDLTPEDLEGKEPGDYEDWVGSTDDDESDDTKNTDADNTDNDDSNSDELKPEDLEGKEPGDYEEWVNNDYVDSNKDPATSEDDLKKDSNAVELKDNADIDPEEGGKIGVSGLDTKTLDDKPQLPNIGPKGFGRVIAQTGGQIGIAFALVVGIVAAIFSSKKKK